MRIFGVFRFLKFQYLRQKAANYPKNVAGYVKNAQNIYQKLFGDIGTKIDATKSTIWNPPIDPWGGGICT